MKRCKWIASLIILLVAITQWTKAQEKSGVYVSSTDWNIEVDQKKQKVEKGTPLKKVLTLLETRYNVNFLFDTNLLAGKNITEQQVLHFNNGLFSILDILLPSFKITYKQLTHRTLGIVPQQEVLPVKMRQEQISGTVTDAQSKETLPGVNILVKGTSTGASTDENGNYELTVESLQDTLVVSFVGYQTQEVPINSRTEIDISLQSQTISGEEMVVIGYGTQQRAEITSSVASVSAEKFEDQSVSSFSQALVGQVAGAQVKEVTGRPGGGLSIKIRGTGSIGAGTEPLYVIDGVPVGNTLRDNSAQGGGTQQPIDPLASLNPDDIESIDILKDASATAIYGSRGSNGVVIISTKNGVSGESNISLNVSTGWQNINKTLPMQSTARAAQTWVDWRNLSWTSLDPNNSASDPNSVRPQRYKIAEEWRDPSQLTDTNWQDAIYRTAPRQKYQLSASGGSENIRYYISANYLDQEGIVIASGYKNYGFRANIDADISDNIHVGINFSPSYSQRNRDRQEGSPYGGGIAALSVRQAPWQPVYNQDGSYSWSKTLHFDDGTVRRELYRNLVANTKLIDRNLDQFRTIGNLFARIDFMEHFSFKSSFGGDINLFNKNVYVPTTAFLSGAVKVPPNDASGSSFSSTNVMWVNQNTLRYDDSFYGKHNVEVLLGFTAQNSDLIRNNVSAAQFPNDRVHTLNAGTVTGGNSFRSDWSLLSMLGRVQYNYNQKYLFEATVRRDGSSRFGANNKWGIFPSGSVGWRIAQEDFMKNVSAISQLKIRASYGISGNNSIGNYASVATLGVDNYIFGSGSGEIVNGLAQNTISQPDLTWEKAKELDIGLDLGLFDRRIYLSADYYNKLNKDLLLNIPLSYATGFTNTTTNIGEVRNKGLEIALETRNIQRADFQWITSINFSLNRNKVEKLGPDGNPILPTENYITRIGAPIGSFYGYIFDGIFKNEQEVDSYPHFKGTRPGDRKFLDINNDGEITPDDKTIYGNNHPDFLYGIQNSMNYKNVDFSFSLQGSQGAMVMNRLKRSLYRRLGANYADYWRSSEQPGDGQEAAPRYNTIHNNDPSSYWGENASYLRIKNVTLGYQLPDHLFGVNSILKRARIYANVQNLYTFTSYEEYNPDVSVNGNQLTPGNNYGTYPLARTIAIGLNFDF